MIVVLSGEGPTDLGRCTNAFGQCQTPEFEYGPMTQLADMVIAKDMGYSLLETTPHNYHYLSEHRLEELEQERKKIRRNVFLPGKKSDHETGYFYVNAWVFGEEAQRIGETENDNDLIAILFRDTDGTRSTAKGLWGKKWDSMIGGFARSGLNIRGVPMLPKPKSEAWLLCAMKEQSYQHCRQLEELSGNDDSSHPAKQLLQEALGAVPSQRNLVDWIKEHGFDWSRASSQMSSLSEFVNRLRDALDIVLHPSKEESTL